MKSNTKKRTNSTTKLPPLKIADIKRIGELRAERLALQRQVDALAIEENALKANALQHTIAAGGKLKKGSFDLSVKESTGSISWKTKFIEVAGADAAAEIAAETPKRKSLVIA